MMPASPTDGPRASVYPTTYLRQARREQSRVAASVWVAGERAAADGCLPECRQDAEASPALHEDGDAVPTAQEASLEKG
eukprot:COSAG02_NODE_134_length_34593_cov_43.594886_3_plen_79_part_00